MAGARVVVVHGYTASPTENWFPWLSKALIEAGARVDVPLMPNAFSPSPSEWAAQLQAELPEVDKNTFLVGHSLGCIALLQHVLTLPKDSVLGGLLLVSGFDRAVQALPELETFTAHPLDHRGVRNRTLQICSILSGNDSIVEPEASLALAFALRSRRIVVPQGGHFLGREGFISFPQALSALERMVDRRVKSVRKQ